MFTTTMYKTKEGFKIECKPKILEGIIAATTLGDTLVEFHLLYLS